MKFTEVKSIQDLQRLGKISDLVDEIQSMISPLKVEADTYEELFKVVQCLQENWLPFAKGPFISRQRELIYYLTMLGGKQRNNAIGITDDLYIDESKAKKWFRELASFVHPDKGGDKDAFLELKKLHNLLMERDENE